MYNIIQLNNKELSELQEIAAEMGLKGYKSLERQNLIYSILDEQAIAGSQKKAAAEEAKGDRRQRARINKKEVANKVYSADKDKAEKINDTPKIVATPIEEKPAPAAAPAKKEKAPATEPTAQQSAPKSEGAAEAEAPKKRGRKPKTDKAQGQDNAAKAEAPAPAESSVEPTPAAPAKEEEKPQAKAEEAPQQAASPLSSWAKYMVITSPFLPEAAKVIFPTNIAPKSTIILLPETEIFSGAMTSYSSRAEGCLSIVYDACSLGCAYSHAESS